MYEKDMVVRLWEAIRAYFRGANLCEVPFPMGKDRLKRRLEHRMNAYHLPHEWRVTEDIAEVLEALRDAQIDKAYLSCACEPLEDGSNAALTVMYRKNGQDYAATIPGLLLVR